MMRNSKINISYLPFFFYYFIILFLFKALTSSEGYYQAEMYDFSPKK